MPIYPSLNDRLKNQQDALEHIVYSASALRINEHPAEGKWSVHDNIAHLASYQRYFLGRITMILKTDCPVFERYIAENDPEFENWRKWETNELIHTLTVDRQLIFERITCLTGEQLNRTGIHKKFGKLTLVQWIEFFLLHEAHHLFTIFKLVNDADLA